MASMSYTRTIRRTRCGLSRLPWRLLGKKYVFDHHDLCPELYRSRYGAEHDLLAKVLQWVEWCNLKLANVTIATNESYKQIQIAARRPEAENDLRGPQRPEQRTNAGCRRPSQRLRDMQKKDSRLHWQPESAGRRGLSVALAEAPCLRSKAG